MTNKNEMPVVAKRYRHKINGELYNGNKYLVIAISDPHVICGKVDNKGKLIVPTVYETPKIIEFWEVFTDDDDVKVNGVEEALERLKKALFLGEDDDLTIRYKKEGNVERLDRKFWQLMGCAQKLVDVLEAERKSRGCEPNEIAAPQIKN